MLLEGLLGAMLMTVTMTGISVSQSLGVITDEDEQDDGGHKFLKKIATMAYNKLTCVSGL